MVSYARGMINRGFVMLERKKKLITVFNQEQYDENGWPPDDAVGFIAWFSDKLETVPEQHRKDVKVDFEGSGYEGGCSIILDIYYYRLETDEEVAIREEKERERQKVIEANDLAKLAELKAKYEK